MDGVNKLNKYRPIRRKNKEISLEETKKVITDARIGVLAVNGDNGYPYAIPLNYYYDDEMQKIYFHGSKIGHKVDSISNIDKVCFTVNGPEVIKEESWAPYVKSVVAFGRCHIIKDSSVAEEKLRLFANKYYPNEMLITEEIEKSGKAVQMFELDIEYMSGKEIQEK